MQCKNHNDREGLNVCSVCNDYFCDECFDSETQVCVSCKEKQDLANDILEDILNTIETPEQAKIYFDPTDILTQIENEINVQQQIEKIEFEINNTSSNNDEDSVEVIVTETVLDDVTIEEEIIETMTSEAVAEIITEDIVESAVSEAIIETVTEDFVETVVTETVVDGIVEELVSEVILEENKVQEDNNNFKKVDLSKDNTNNANNSNATSETNNTKSLSWKEKLFGEKSENENENANANANVDVDVDVDVNNVKTETSNNTDDTAKKQPKNFYESFDELADKTKEGFDELTDKTKEGFNDLKDKTQEGINDFKDKMYENQKVPVTEDMEEILTKIEDTNKNGEYDHLLSKFNRYYGQDSGKTNSSNANSKNTDSSSTNSSSTNDDVNLALPLRINNVLYFIASLIPGAAQLYLGLTKRGTTILIIAAVFLFLTSNPSLFIITTILSFADAQKLRNIYYRGGKIEDTNADIMALMKNGYVIIIIIAAVILGV